MNRPDGSADAVPEALDGEALRAALHDLPLAHGGTEVSGVLRAELEDFMVDELLPFQASGAGEHYLVHLEKRGANTTWVADQLARFAGVRPAQVGYAGMKDRHAVTRQFFSVPVPIRRSLDWSALSVEGVRLLDCQRHDRKLRRGALSGNRFALRVRDIAGDPEQLESRLSQVSRYGVPNYFGPQRFGRGGANLDQLMHLARGARMKRQRRSLLLSTTRAFLFNQVLAERVRAGTWDRALEGDIFILNGRHGRFGPTPLDTEIKERVGRGEIHPSGPLYGDAPSPCEGRPAQLESDTEQRFAPLARVLSSARVAPDRRPLRMLAADLTWAHEQGCLSLAFALPAGSYATSLLRELVRVREPTQRP